MAGKHGMQQMDKRQQKVGWFVECATFNMLMCTFHILFLKNKEPVNKHMMQEYAKFILKRIWNTGPITIIFSFLKYS